MEYALNQFGISVAATLLGVVGMVVIVLLLQAAATMTRYRSGGGSHRQLEQD